LPIKTHIIAVDDINFNCAGHKKVVTVRSNDKQHDDATCKKIDTYIFFKAPLF